MHKKLQALHFHLARTPVSGKTVLLKFMNMETAVFKNKTRTPKFL